MLDAFGYAKLRAKIEALIRKPGIPDEDCPDDPASTRWWCTVGGKFTDRESMSVEMKAAAGVAPNTEAMSSILGDHCGGGLQALTNGPGGSGGAGPSLEQLVSVMNNQISAKAAAKAKAKSKAKAKANPALQAAKTPAEIREAHRDLANAMILLFLSFCRFQ